MSLHDALLHAGLVRPLDHGRDAGVCDVGGVRAFFRRGLDAGDAASPGVCAWTFAPAVVTALDALFAGHGDTEVAA